MKPRDCLETNIKYITNGETDSFIYLLGYISIFGVMLGLCFATI